LKPTQESKKFLNSFFPSKPPKPKLRSPQGRPVSERGGPIRAALFRRNRILTKP
jgi:hypothetical protein